MVRREERAGIDRGKGTPERRELRTTAITKKDRPAKNAEEMINPAFETTVFLGANRTPRYRNSTKIQRNQIILHDKHMHNGDLDIIPTFNAE